MKAHYDQLTFEEKVSATGTVVKLFVSFYGPFVVIGVLGLDFWNWFLAQAWPVRCLIFAPLWALSYVAVEGILRDLAIFAERLLQSAVNAADAIASAVANLLTLAVYGSGRLAAGAIGLALYPLRLLCEFVWDQAQARTNLWLQGWREAREKRRLYREEFRADFKTFRDFERYFDDPDSYGADDDGFETETEAEAEAESGRDYEPEPANPDAFTAACRLLGLPEDGSFTQEELKKQYRAAVFRTHPDRGGSNELVMDVNGANATIRMRKGWS